MSQSALVAPPAAVPLPPRLWVPIDAPENCLSTGTHVRRGQALSNCALAALSPADGIIAGVCDIMLCNGRSSTALQIDVDAQPAASTEAAATSQIVAPDNLPLLIDRLRQAGVVADRTTSPNLLAQLDEATRTPSDTLICNLVDVDAGSMLCGHLVREHGPLIVSALSAIAKAAGISRVWIASTSRLAGRMSVHVRKAGAMATRMKVAALSSAYPQSNPTMLVYALTGRRLRPDRLPPDVGTIILDGAAAIAVGRCLESGAAMLTLPVEIRDSRRAKSFVITAAIGTPLRDVLAALGLRGPFTLRGGAALRDIRLSPDAVVGAGELTIDAGPITPPINPDLCIRCGWCVENCPVRIHPAAILDAAQENDTAFAEHHGLPACIECGICSYVCPSRLPLLDSIRALKRGA